MASISRRNLEKRDRDAIDTDAPREAAPTTQAATPNMVIVPADELAGLRQAIESLQTVMRSGVRQDVSGEVEPLESRLNMAQTQMPNPQAYQGQFYNPIQGPLHNPTPHGQGNSSSGVVGDGTEGSTQPHGSDSGGVKLEDESDSGGVKLEDEENEGEWGGL